MNKYISKMTTQAKKGNLYEMFVWIVSTKDIKI
jgi:hypothetical protein